MVTNTPIDKESFRLTQAAQKVQELLDLIQSLSEDGYTNDLQSLVDVVEDWNDSDTGASFAVQLQNIFADFLSKQEILPKIIATGETYQTEVNGENVSLGSDMPVRSSTIYEALAQYGIKQLPSGSSWSRVDGMLGYYTALFGSASDPSDDGLYLYSGQDTAGMQAKYNLDRIYLVDKDGDTFGGIIQGGLPAGVAAIIKITHADGAEVLFTAQSEGNYLEQQFIEALPEQNISSDFSSSSERQFVSSNKTTISRTTQDDRQCQLITTTGNLSSSYYAVANFDFSDIVDDAKYLTIEFDSKIPNLRWYVSLANSQYRPGTSASAAYDNDGLAFKQGVGTTSNYIVNDSTTSNTDMYNNWVHTKLIVNLELKTVDYTITQQETNSRLSGTVSFVDDSAHTSVVDCIEVYSWSTDNNIYIANMSITVFDDTTNETTRYLIQQDDGNTVEYIFYDGKFVCTGRGGGSITVDDIADGTITSEKLDFEPFTVISAGGISEYATPNYCIETGIYMFSGISGGMGSGEGFPTISGTPGTTLKTGALYVVRLAFQVTQLFVSLGPHAAIRSGFLTSEGEVNSFSEWKIIDEISDGAVTPEKATFTQYSETPLQIGTWIDGTPVWRLAFESEVAADTTDEILITFAASDNNVRVLLCKVWLTMVSEGYGVSNIDSYEVDPNGEKTYYSTNSSAGKLSIIKGTATPENRVYGYIDFVTPESNILSS